MPMFIAALLGALIEAAGTLVGKVLLSLGIGYAVFTGVDLSIAWARDFAVSSIQALPPVAVGIASTLQIGTFIAMVSSALVVRMTMAGLQSGTVKRMVQK
jgi:hypothetical protein